MDDAPRNGGDLSKKSEEAGLVMVYTGSGKGKTTAALGLALRQVGWGRRVLVVQFMKGEDNVYGERIAAQEYLPLLEIEQHGRSEFVDLDDPAEVDKKLARGALDRVKEALSSGKYSMIVLDEVNVAVAAGVLELGDLLAVLDTRPQGVDLVLTGRYCPKEVIDRSDMASEVVELKHHYARGVQARQGIEY